MHTFVTDRRKTLCLPTTGETSMQSQNVCVSIKTITGYAQFQTNRFLNIRQSKNAFRLTDQHIMTILSCGLSNEHSCKKKRVISHNVFFTILDLYQNEFSFSKSRCYYIVYFLLLSDWTSDQKQNHNQPQVIPVKFKFIQPIRDWRRLKRNEQPDDGSKTSYKPIYRITELYSNRYLKYAIDQNEQQKSGDWKIN